MSSIWTIRRSATDVKLTGLCGGIARHWGVDPVLIRVGCALLALSGGIGLVLYLAGWLLIPVESKTQAPIHDLLGEHTRRWPRELWIAIVAVGCIITLAMLGPLIPFGFGPAVVLALIWYFGYYKNRPTPRNDLPAALPPQVQQPGGPAPAPQFFSYPGPATPFTEAAQAWRQRIEEAQRATQPSAVYRGAWDAAPVEPDEDLREPIGPAASLPPAHPLGAESVAHSAFLALPDPVGLYVEPSAAVAATPVRPPKRSASLPARRLRLVSVVAVGLTLSALGTAAAVGVQVPMTAYFAATLLVLGLTLVAATWFGRARGILPVALLAGLLTVGSTVSGPVAADQNWGVQQVRYTTPAELTTGDSRELGQLQVDLTGLRTSTDLTYTAHVGVGDLEVTTPKSVNVVVNWRVKSGALILDGEQTQGGSDLSDVVRPAKPDPRKKTLTLNLSVDRGVVQVQR